MMRRIATFEHGGNHNRVVAVPVARRIEQRHRAVGTEGAQPFDRGRIGPEFGTIRRLEMRPSPPIMSEFATEFVARPDLLQPDIDCRLLSRKSAWPKAINQDPRAVLRFRRVVDAPKPDRVGGHPPWFP